MERLRCATAQLYVRDVMTGNPRTISGETSVEAARHLMQQYRLEALPVCEDGRLIGLLREADLLRVLPSPATSLAVHEVHYLLNQLTVAEIMGRFPVTVSPHHPVSEAIRRMLSHQVDALPVTENRKVVGMLTRADLLQAFSRWLATPLLAA